MSDLHPDSSAIDRIGIDALMKRFGLRRRAIQYWRRRGVPDVYRRDIALMGKRAGHDMPEMKTMLGRRPGRPPASGKSPTSPAASA